MNDETKFQIKHRFTDAVLFECELPAEIASLSTARQLGYAVKEAIKAGAYLADANLADANLAGADLAGADLAGANLADANLADADLAGANLAGANLADANLAGANLAGANLADANLADANLARANLAGIRADLFRVLDAAPAEVPGLLAALREGRVDGAVYQGECACLVGTLANVRGVAYTDLGDLRPDGDRAAERWFLAVARGDTPATSQVVAITARWIEEWSAARAASDAPLAP